MAWSMNCDHVIFRVFWTVLAYRSQSWVGNALNLICPKWMVRGGLTRRFEKVNVCVLNQTVKKDLKWTSGSKIEALKLKWMVVKTVQIPPFGPLLDFRAVHFLYI